MWRLGKSSNSAFLPWLVLAVSATICGCDYGKAVSAPRVPPPRETAADPGVRDQPPNVIWILLDASRAKNFSCYGYERRTTPNLESLAGRGALFERNYSQAPYTVASVPCYMTGRYFPVSCTSSRDWRELFNIPPATERLLPAVLREHGYFTKLISASRWITPDSRLYEAFDDPAYLHEGPPPIVYVEFEQVNDAFFTWLDSRPPQPFFAYLHTMDTHSPHILKPPYNQWIDESAETTSQIDRARGEAINPTGPFNFTAADQAFLTASYDGGIARADAGVGALLHRLDEKGLLEHTIIIIGSDHGELLGEDGKTWGHPDLAYDELFHVPLIMAGPGIPQGVRVKELTQNVDIMPTILDLLHLAPKIEMQGRSLVPLFADRGAWNRGYVFAKRPKGLHDALSVSLYTDTLRYDYDCQDKTEHVWTLPDSLRGLRDASNVPPASMAAFRDIVTREITPLLEQTRNLPCAAPDLPFVEPLPQKMTPADAFTTEHDKHDNKWSLKHGVLGSWGTENVPPISFQMEVPNGTYHVAVRCYTSSHFRVKGQHEHNFKEIAEDPSHSGWRYSGIGTYTVADGVLRITLDDIPDKQNLIETFRFVPVGIRGESNEDATATEEGLKAMGYL